jgi:hypothetical protein
MHKALIAAWLIVAVFSCDSTPQNEKHLEKEQGKPKSSNYSRLRLDFGEPVQIDTTPYVMFPLSVAHEDRGFIMKSSGDGAYYWNIIFLDTKTGQYHLLEPAKKILIKAYDADQTSADEVINSHSIYKGKTLFYEVVTDDTNHDGKLDENDAVCLFISDEAGNNFKRISPAGYSIRSWKILKENNKVLINAVSAGSTKDDDADQQIVPFVYDIQSGASARPVFATDFIEKTKKLFNRQWTGK